MDSHATCAYSLKKRNYLHLPKLVDKVHSSAACVYRTNIELSVSSRSRGKRIKEQW
jgi:hypothetical protein